MGFIHQLLTGEHQHAHVFKVFALCMIAGVELVSCSYTPPANRSETPAKQELWGVLGHWWNISKTMKETRTTMHFPPKTCGNHIGIQQTCSKPATRLVENLSGSSCIVVDDENPHWWLPHCRRLMVNVKLPHSISQHVSQDRTKESILDRFIHSNMPETAKNNLTTHSPWITYQVSLNFKITPSHFLKNHPHNLA